MDQSLVVRGLFRMGLLNMFLQFDFFVVCQRCNDDFMVRERCNNDIMVHVVWRWNAKVLGQVGTVSLSPSGNIMVSAIVTTPVASSLYVLSTEQL